PKPPASPPPAPKETPTKRTSSELRAPNQIRNRKAVVAGINNYRPQINQLSSCINDANLMVSLLGTQYGFAPKDIQVRLDEAATLSNLKESLAWLFDGATQDDALVFFFSGHGYRVQIDEVWRESLVLYDDFFFDQDFSKLTQPLPEGVLTTVLDACHSGGMEKDLFIASDFARKLHQLGATRRVELAKVKAYIDPRDFGATTGEKAFLPATQAHQRSWLHRSSDERAGEIPFRGFGRPVQILPGVAVTKAYDPQVAAEPPQANCTLLTACTAEQTAAAGTQLTKNLSVFTFTLGQVLGGTPNVSYAQCLQQAAAQISSLGFQQTPELLVTPDTNWVRNRSVFLNTDFGAAPKTVVPVSLPFGLGAPTAPAVTQSNEGVKTMTYPQMPNLPGLSQLVGLPSGLTHPLMATGPQGADKGWTDVLQHLVSTAPALIGPLVNTIGGAVSAASKGYQPAADKGWSDVFQHLVSTAPALIGPLVNTIGGAVSAASKGYQPAGADKGWTDVLSSLASSAPALLGPLVNTIGGAVSAASKGYQPAVMGTAADKGWTDVLQHLVSTAPALIGPLVNTIGGAVSAASKGYQPAADKGWSDVFQHLVNTAPALIGPLVNTIGGAVSAASKGYQPAGADKGWTDVLSSLVSSAPHLIGPLVNTIGGAVSAASKGYQPAVMGTAADKGWTDVLQHLVSTAPALIGPLVSTVTGAVAAARQ
ncbi:caspase family protein, partial [Myxococcus sp. CA039A]|uniref:caspase family protein n=1 Tax=Myxococcus sp. CA039A TaxID=2741737 RepID=UPI00157B375B